MTARKNLTNEKLSKRFDNPFALVNYAISLAKIEILRGQGYDSNPANDVVDLITSGGDLIVPLADEIKKA